MAARTKELGDSSRHGILDGVRAARKDFAWRRRVRAASAVRGGAIRSLQEVRRRKNGQANRETNEKTMPGLRSGRYPTVDGCVVFGRAIRAGRVSNQTRRSNRPGLARQLNANNR